MRNKISHIVSLLVIASLAQPFAAVNGYAVGPVDEKNGIAKPQQLELTKSEAASYDEALCGAKPISPQQTAQQAASIKSLEQDMPPVTNQNPADWCYAFSATDMLNYQIHLWKKSQGLNSDYGDTSLISPIDAVSAQQNFIDKNMRVPISKPGELNMREGGFSEDVFLALQQRGMARSRAQVSYSPLEEDNPTARNLVKNIISEYKNRTNYSGEAMAIAGEACPMPLYQDPKFIDQVKGFQAINSWLTGIGKQNSLMESGTKFNRYEDVVSQFKGQPDIKLPPFTSNQFETENPNKFLRKIRDVLSTQHRPIGTSLCFYDIQPNPDDKTDNCGAHAMTIVGAAYVNGACTIRLRNTWGAKWRDGGYVNLKVEEYLKAVTDHKSMNLAWVNDGDNEARYETEKVTFIGQMAKETRNDLAKNNNKYFPSQYKYVNGTLYDKDKSEFIFQNGKRIQVKNYTFDSGGVFTGAVDDHGATFDAYTGMLRFSDNSSIEYQAGRRFYHNAIWSGKSGSRYSGLVGLNNMPEAGSMTDRDGSQTTYKNGLAISVLNNKLGNDSYSGEVYGSPDGTWKVKTGRRTMPDGSYKDFRDGISVYYNNAIWNTDNGSRLTGSAQNNKPFDGTLTYPDQHTMRYQNGVLVYVSNFKTKEGRIFTGDVQAKQDGSFDFVRGTLKSANGSVVNYP